MCYVLSYSPLLEEYTRICDQLLCVHICVSRPLLYNIHHTVIGLLKMFSPLCFADNIFIIIFRTSKLADVCADVISACDVWCHMSRADVTTPIVGKCKRNQF